ncbi:MAG TPA: plasmid pRiA4b ORF-3 family protein [Candidatus Sulfotelmatobacter sp.]|nr:plasmid pRiA4b ORF-3 family protein [Candidatus Sulfotelmatobacter sp.]
MGIPIDFGALPSKAAPSTFQLKITLVGIEPPIWRRIQVPTSIKLCCLHSALQVVMGWTDSHLHQFERNGKNWGVPDNDEFNEFDLIDENTTQLAQVLTSEGDSLVYHYDFGNDWRHEVVLAKIRPADSTSKHPVCLAGERRCPLEDVGGVDGYREFLEVVFDPSHEDYEQLVQWAGGHFVDECDLKAVNKKLSRMRWPVRDRR